MKTMQHRPRDAKGRFVSVKALQIKSSIEPKPMAEPKAVVPGLIFFANLKKVGNKYMIPSNVYVKLCKEFTKEFVDEARDALVYAHKNGLVITLLDALRLVSHPKFKWNWIAALAAASKVADAKEVLAWISKNPGENVWKQFPSRGYPGISKEISRNRGKLDRLLAGLSKDRPATVSGLRYLAMAAQSIGWID